MIQRAVRVQPQNRERYEEAVRLRAAGWSVGRVADALNLPTSTAWRWLDPEYNERQKQRSRDLKETYRGTCRECGGTTSGCNGPGRAAELCGDCSRQKQRDNKIWTRDTVLDAIRRFAAEHGRPPTAYEWLYRPGPGYPYVNSVMGSGNQPFAKWADAIQAAGFPRPGYGRRTRNEGGVDMAAHSRLGYVVLRDNEDGTWTLVLESDKHTPALALTDALNGHEPKTGERWVAVTRGYWQPRTVQPRTVYEFAKE